MCMDDVRLEKGKSTRRLVLSGIIGLALGTFIKSNVRQATAAAPRKTFIPHPSSNELTQPRLSPEEKLTDQQTPQLTEEQALQTEPIKEAKEISLLFPNTTSFEKSEAVEMIDKQITHYKSEPEYEKRVQNTIRWKNIVFESARNLGFRENSPFPKLLLSLIYVESGGDPNASPSKDEDAAKGLCQIKPSTALSIARRLGMKTPPNLSDPRTNITLSLEYFDRLFRLFPDPSLAFWSYHLGEGNLVKAMKKYLVWEKGAKQQTIDDLLDNPDYGSSYLVRVYKLNFVNLITSKRVVNELKDIDAFNNDTQFHVPRVGAATSLLNT